MLHIDALSQKPCVFDKPGIRQYASYFKEIIDDGNSSVFVGQMRNSRWCYNMQIIDAPWLADNPFQGNYFRNAPRWLDSMLTNLKFFNAEMAKFVCISCVS